MGGLNIEQLLDELASAVELVVYFNPEELGILNATNRVVIVEPGTTVDDVNNPGGTDIALEFNDPDTDDEVLTVTLDLMGGVVLDGGISLGITSDPGCATPLYFQTLTIISQGDGVTENALSGGTENIIAGDIVADPDVNSGQASNNLLDVNIEATQALVIGDGSGDGTIFLNNAESR